MMHQGSWRKNAWRTLVGMGLASVFLCGCSEIGEGLRLVEGRNQMSISKRSFGETPDGKEVSLYTIENSNGVRADITNYGGIVVRLFVPDREGNMEDVVLGYDNLDAYIEDSPYFGALIGRYGNRIAKGRFVLNGIQYDLATNNDANHLHGGIKGFDKVVWDVQTIALGDDTADGIKASGVGLILKYLSKAGEEGYPGNLDVTVTYLLTNEDELKIHYNATTDQPTPVNLTHHSYFNLAGQGEGDILAHELMINADRFTPVDAGLIPTGELRAVESTPMDFTEPTAIGARIEQDDQQLEYGGGYDHNWVLNKPVPGEMTLAARVYEPTSGRVMEVHTTEPGLQFYSGNFLDGSNVGKEEKAYKHRYGFCLETQHFPDSPNQPNFPSTILRPGEVYDTTTIYRFTTRNP